MITRTQRVKIISKNDGVWRTETKLLVTIYWFLIIPVFVKQTVLEHIRK